MTVPGARGTGGAPAPGESAGEEVLRAILIMMVDIVIALLIFALIQSRLPSEWNPAVALIVIELVVAMLTFLFLRRRSVVVQEGEVAVLERDGRFSRLLGTGRHIIPPGESVRVCISTREQSMDVGPIEVFVRPTHQVTVSAVVSYITGAGAIPADPALHRNHAAYQLVYNVQNWEQALRTRTEAMVHSVLNRSDLKTELLALHAPAPTILPLHTSIEEQITLQLQAVVLQWGIAITNVFLKVGPLPDTAVQSIKGDSAVKKAQQEAAVESIKAQSDAARYKTVDKPRLDDIGDVAEKLIKAVK
jgi:regulator of protease activity HflC (stomatin/prohibitin superfamily)